MKEKRKELKELYTEATPGQLLANQTGKFKYEDLSDESQNQTETNQDEIDSKNGGSTERKMMNMLNTLVLNHINASPHMNPSPNLKHSKKGSINSDSHSPKSSVSRHDAKDISNKLEHKGSFVSSNNKSFKIANDTTPKRLKLVTELVDEEMESPDNKRKRGKHEDPFKPKNEDVIFGSKLTTPKNDMAFSTPKSMKENKKILINLDNYNDGVSQVKELNVSEGSSSGSSKAEDTHHDKRISLLHATTVEVDQNDDNEPPPTMEEVEEKINDMMLIQRKRIFDEITQSYEMSLEKIQESADLFEERCLSIETLINQNQEKSNEEFNNTK